MKPLGIQLTPKQATLLAGLPADGSFVDRRGDTGTWHTLLRRRLVKRECVGRTFRYART